MVESAEGAIVRVICGEVDGATGPVQDIMTDPEYLDVTLPAGSWFEHAVPRGRTVFAYVFEGSGSFGPGERGAGGPGEGGPLWRRGRGGATAGQETSRGSCWCRGVRWVSPSPGEDPSS